MENIDQERLFAKEARKAGFTEAQIDFLMEMNLQWDGTFLWGQDRIYEAEERNG